MGIWSRTLATGIVAISGLMLMAAKRPPQIGYWLDGRFIEMRTKDLCLAPNFGRLYSSDPNSSYLFYVDLTQLQSNYYRSSFSSESATFFGGPLLDPGRAQAMRQEYETMVLEYERKTPYNENNPHTEAGYMEKLKNFSQYVLRSIFDYQMKEGFKKAEKRSEEVRTFAKVQKVVEKVAYATTNVAISDSFKFGSSTDIPNQTGQVWMKSVLFDGSFDFNFGESWKSNQTAEEALKQRGVESYQLTLHRGIPIWNMTSRITYGLVSTNLTASLSKQFTNEIRGEFASLRGLDQGRTTIPGGAEDRISLFYDFHF